ncbi:hypothetical protein [Streptomyces sp. NPDC056948]|uniref:hypothetical protein n=1 Tax=Streptomyces sp. NPDC056948 TaxID=3345975 RepID=UPI003645D439
MIPFPGDHAADVLRRPPTLRHRKHVGLSESRKGPGHALFLGLLPPVRAARASNERHDRLKVEELPGFLQVPANGVLVDAEALHRTLPD